MNPVQPALYLDPLLPLYMRRDPGVLPRSSAPDTRGLVIAVTGGYHVTGGAAQYRIPAPGLLRLSMDSGCRVGGTGRRWFVAMGGRLVDQLVVGAFGDPGYSRFLDELGTPGLIPCDRIDQRFESVLQELEDELANRGPAYRVRSRSLLTSALLSLYRSTLVTPELTNGDGTRLGAVLDYIELNYAGELRLADLARIMQTSPSYFSRLFRHEVGMPLFEHINRTRIRKACLLLRNPELPITRIAFDVGYNSVSFFNRYFRRIMNVSPREYRRHLAG